MPSSQASPEKRTPKAADQSPSERRATLSQTQITIAVKRSKWERDLRLLGSRRELERLYQRRSGLYERAYASHLRQSEALARLIEALPEAELLFREELSTERLKSAALVISFGGDNHFIYVSQFIEIGSKLLGLNSDPETSVGALLSFDIESLLARQRERRIDPQLACCESWPRIVGQIDYPDGSSITTQSAASEISIRNRSPDMMSRYFISRSDSSDSAEEQKSSGMLLATGAGSTGWFRNALPESKQLNANFERDAERFAFTVREPSYGRDYRYASGFIEADQSIRLLSEMDGGIVCDSDHQSIHPFPEGATAHFRLAEEGLRVVRDFVAP